VTGFVFCYEQLVKIEIPLDLRSQKYQLLHVAHSKMRRLRKLLQEIFVFCYIPLYNFYKLFFYKQTHTAVKNKIHEWRMNTLCFKTCLIALVPVSKCYVMYSYIESNGDKKSGTSIRHLHNSFVYLVYFRFTICVYFTEKILGFNILKFIVF
jgi:hypothetical protein